MQFASAPSLAFTRFLACENGDMVHFCSEEKLRLCKSPFQAPEKCKLHLPMPRRLIACAKVADYPSPMLPAGADVFSACVYGANKGVCPRSLIQQLLLGFP